MFSEMDLLFDDSRTSYISAFLILFSQIYLVIDEIRRFQKNVYNFQEVGRLLIVFFCVNIWPLVNK